MLHCVRTSGKYLFDNNTKFGISLEDASRTPPGDIELAIGTAIDAGAASISICDTVGECTPDGAAKLTEFCMKQIEKAGIHIDVVWHGHNDKGLSLANAMAAAMAGAQTISGTFSGLGERAGNTPLEQIIMLLFQAGNTQFDLTSLSPYCRKLAEYTHTPIPANTPLTGSQAFATSAGTHAAAILKARQLGQNFEDYVFSGVPASVLGRIQDVIIGPASGRANARYMLEQIGITATEDFVQKLMKHARTKDRRLTSEDIRQYIQISR